MRFVLDCNRVVLNYMYEILGGFKRYPYEGSFEDQPKWFISLLNTAFAEKNRLDKAKAERERKMARRK